MLERLLKSEANKARPEKLATDLKLIIEELQKEVKDLGIKSVTEAPREYLISHTVTPDALKAFSNLPFEAFLSNHRAGITLLTGQQSSVMLGKGGQGSLRRTYAESKFTMHNHGGDDSLPSGSDMITTTKTKNSQMDFILSDRGITIFKGSFMKYMKMASDDLRKVMTLMFISDAAVSRDIKEGYIEGVIPWNDSRIQAICDYINSDADWQAYKNSLLYPAKTEGVRAPGVNI